MNYLFSRDNSRNFRLLENRTREIIPDAYELHGELEKQADMKFGTKVFCSALPNLIDCAGMGLGLYYQDVGPTMVLGILGEGIRNLSRKSVRRYFERRNG